MSNNIDMKYDFSNASEIISTENIENMIKKYSDKAKQKINDILINEYNLDANTAKRVEETINSSVSSEMATKYRFKEPFITSSELGTEDRPHLILIRKYPDFLDWWFTAMVIPFYQSLGDTIGYKNGDWEFTDKDTNELIYEFIHLGGINDISIVNWMSSDDTILYMATLGVLSKKIHNINEFGEKLRTAYLDTLPLIETRHPGETTMRSLDVQKNIEWNKLPYSSRDIGAGAAMRSGCIGIFFPGKHNRKKLISLAIESSRITHNSATAILGSIVAALFTAYALERVPINHWPHKLLDLLRSDKIDKYMEESRPNEYKLFVRDKVIFIGQWEKYVNRRFSGLKPKLDLKMMRNPVLRYDYLSKNFSKGCDMPGACGDDCVIFAYDALLESGPVVEKLVIYSILNPGDSDTVGSIAMSWFGAYYHSLKNQLILESKFEELEFYDKLFNFYGINATKMAKVYYYDMYLNTARKYLKQVKPKK